MYMYWNATLLYDSLYDSGKKLMICKNVPVKIQILSRLCLAYWITRLYFVKRSGINWVYYQIKITLLTDLTSWYWWQLLKTTLKSFLSRWFFLKTLRVLFLAIYCINFINQRFVHWYCRYFNEHMILLNMLLISITTHKSAKIIKHKCMN